MCLCCLVLSGCATLAEDDVDLTDENSITIDGGNAPAATWDYPIALSDLQSDYIRLASLDSLLEADYAPADLVDITVKRTSSSAIQMRTVAAQALSDMFEAAAADGLTLYAHSGYRSYQTQKTMYYNRLERLGKDDGAVAYPGSSDHQTGLGIDVISKEWIGSSFNTKFAQTAEAQWMAANCMDYGFIIRYPEDKQQITNIMYEPWHLRYVGVDVAQYMMGNGMCLEEFTEEWQSNLADFEAAGGNVQQTIIASQLPDEAVILEDEVGPDGDYEISLFH